MAMNYADFEAFSRLILVTLVYWPRLSGKKLDSRGRMVRGVPDTALIRGSLYEMPIQKSLHY